MTWGILEPAIEASLLLRYDPAQPNETDREIETCKESNTSDPVYRGYLKQQVRDHKIYDKNGINRGRFYLVKQYQTALWGTGTQLATAQNPPAVHAKPGGSTILSRY